MRTITFCLNKNALNIHVRKTHKPSEIKPLNTDLKGDQVWDRSSGATAYISQYGDVRAL